MNNWIFLMGLITVLLVVLGVFAVYKAKKMAEIRIKHPGRPKGYYMNQGVGVGLAIGAGIGTALGNLSIGVGVGVAIGLVIGSRLETQHKDKLRPVTEEEKAIRNQAIIFVLGILLAGIIVIALKFLLSK